MAFNMIHINLCKVSLPASDLKFQKFQIRSINPAFHLIMLDFSTVIFIYSYAKTVLCYNTSYQHRANLRDFIIHNLFLAFPTERY